MKGNLKYTRDYHWTRAPQVWGMGARIAVWAFLLGVIVGAALF